jgi:hypothetical protein
MRLPPVRFTVRRMLVVVTIAGVVLGGVRYVLMSMPLERAFFLLCMAGVFGCLALMIGLLIHDAFSGNNLP